LLLMAVTTMSDLAADHHDQAQERLIREIESDFRDTAYLTGRNRMSPAVIAAMRDVPRHDFVEASNRNVAYINRPLSIGHGQTISQPFIVALMTELIDAEQGDRVLEIGTGSGYQAAVLAKLVIRVYTIEIVAPLAERARARLDTLGYDNVTVLTGDGNHGWPDEAPFDAIVVTAAGRIPGALLEQLKPGGRMVIPVDTAPGQQELMVVDKGEDGSVERRTVLPVRFVPLTGDN
jgi:protein-L-isoaspartate(D-aspartate) O-methyltransferase